MRRPRLRGGLFPFARAAASAYAVGFRMSHPLFTAFRGKAYPPEGRPLRFIGQMVLPKTAIAPCTKSVNLLLIFFSLSDYKNIYFNMFYKNGSICFFPAKLDSSRLFR
ncbi:hypothetical protein WCP94_003029 [Bilophila wadsworthia]